MIRRISKCWKGEENLYIVFWIYGVLINSFLLILIETLWWPFVFVPIANMQLGKSIESIGYHNLFFLVLVLIALIVVLIYQAWVVVSIWRCARSSKRKWMWITRVLVSILIIAGAVNLIFMNNEDLLHDDISVDLTQIGLGMENLPAEDKWNSIRVGTKKEAVISLIGDPPNCIDFEDGTAIWKYWSQKVEDEHDLKYAFSPFGETYIVYIDSSGRVSKKEIVNITKTN